MPATVAIQRIDIESTQHLIILQTRKLHKTTYAILTLTPPTRRPQSFYQTGHRRSRVSDKVEFMLRTSDA